MPDKIDELREKEVKWRHLVIDWFRTNWIPLVAGAVFAVIVILLAGRL